MCPHAALSVAGVPVEDCTEFDPRDYPEPEAVELLLKSRRSIRKYQDKTVPMELILRIIDTARFAPSAINQQIVNWTVVRTENEVDRLARLVTDWMRGYKRFSRMVEAFDAGKDVVFRGAPHVACVHAPQDSYRPVVDSAIAMTYFEQAAWANGVGTCWAGLLMNAAGEHPQVAEALKIPEGHKLYAAMMLGYPKLKYRRIPVRPKASIKWI